MSDRQVRLKAQVFKNAIEGGNTNKIIDQMLSKTVIKQDQLTILIHMMSKDPTRLMAYLAKIKLDEMGLDIERTVFEMVEAGMMKEAKDFAFKHSSSSYVKLMIRSALSCSPDEAIHTYESIINYINTCPLPEKAQLFVKFGKYIVESLYVYAMTDKYSASALVAIKKVRVILVSIFSNPNCAKYNPEDFVEILESEKDQLFLFLKEVQKFSNNGTKFKVSDKVKELLLEKEICAKNEKPSKATIAAFQTIENKQLYDVNVLFEKKVLDETVTDPDVKMLCLLQEGSTEKINEDDQMDIEYLPIVKKEEDPKKKYDGVENIIKGLLRGDQVPQHRSVLVFDEMKRFDITSDTLLENGFKESMKNGLSFITQIPELQREIEKNGPQLKDMMVMNPEKCSKCNNEFKDLQSEYPIATFMCGHSFHMKEGCFPPNGVCSICNGNGPLTEKECDEKYRDAINEKEFNGFFDLVKSVPVLVQPDDNGEESEEEEEDNIRYTENTETFENREDEQMVMDNSIKAEELNLNPYFSASGSEIAAKMDIVSAYTSSEFTNTKAMQDPFFGDAF
ncbi:hypothetical protein EIN_079450 [Entamoeba invadens IP1]|uniref:hypothetical protein n=1 Tax=Entamoeba invadens IP1 TaxID=370355 RepID=UPI0002C3FA49|nr:hypothetical protein EIN_079450 [Entamoeba invadens IP1]ELP85023.1 hypothetical protein EIN_079450 [Entamoeba invadens IP1]|eukprot:XP_004184369.1 hypothetical protein EIN_079450 [Entamoeba invadens IP1]